MINKMYQGEWACPHFHLKMPMTYSAEALLKALCADDADLAAKVALLEHPSGVVSVVRIPA